MPIALKRSTYRATIFAAVVASGLAMLLVILVYLRGEVSFRVDGLFFTASAPGVNISWPVDSKSPAYSKSIPGFRFSHEKPLVLYSGIHMTVPPPNLPPPRDWDQIEISWLLLVLGPVVFCLGLAAVRNHHTKRLPGFCPTCGYDLRATPARCPECGTAAAASTAVGSKVLHDFFTRSWTRQCFVFTASFMTWAAAVLGALALARFHQP